MGVVYKAKDTRRDLTVALKVLSDEMARDADAQERFRREARAASMLDHPNICKVLEVGEREGRLFLVMPFIEGLTLRQCLAAKAFTIEEMLRLSAQLVSALEAAHAKGIIHRDIKPGNIIIDRQGNAQILDFGLAKRVRASDEADFSSAWGRTLTATGMPVGTIEYMSPEQVRGEQLDVRTDLFSLGMVLYEIATRRRAFDASSPGVLLESILTRTPPAPSLVNPDLPSGFDQIIQKLLEKDRDLRYQTAKDLRADLRRLRRQEDSGRAAAAANRHKTGRESARPALRLRSRLSRLSPLTRAAVMAAAVLLVALVLGLVIRTPPAPALTDRDTIVLTDFSNTTGDPVFDDTLKQALAVELGQSPYLNIFPNARAREALSMMGRSPDDRVTRELARQICLREGSQALIAGSISRLGQNYVVTLEAVDAHSGQTLASEQGETNAKEKILQTLGRLASGLRARLGESLSSIEKFDAPLDRATTPSLDALRAFSLGNAERARGREFDSIPFFKRALELDPQFALAHARLGAVYSNVGETAFAIQHSRKAYELRDRVSERERYYIAAHYFGTVTGEVNKSIANYELWRRTYPRDATPVINLSTIWNELGQFERALAEAQAALTIINTNRPFASINVAAAHMGAGRFSAARQVLEEMMAENPQSSSPPVLLFMIGCAQRDRALMQRQLDWSDGREGEATLYQFQAQALASSGELAKSREIFRHSIDVARRFNRRELVASTHARQAQVESLFGNARQARAGAEEALKLAPGKESRAIAALALALAADFDRAQKVADDLAKRYTEDSILNAVSLPAVRAAIEIERGRPARAVELLRAVEPYELGFAAGVAPTYLRGLAYLRAGEGTLAAAEFEKIIARPGVAAVSPLHSLAHLELARAARMAGDQSKSHAAYQEFLALWKNADADVPILKQAMSEFSRD